MARVKSHVIRGQNVSEYDLPSQKYTITIASGPISSYTNAHRAHTNLRFYGENSSTRGSCHDILLRLLRKRPSELVER